jgi:hypothetical protein
LLSFCFVPLYFLLFAPTLPKKLFLCTPLRHRGCEATHPLINLTLELQDEKWSASCPGHFLPSRRAPSTHQIRGRKGPRVGVEPSEKGNFSCPCLESNQDTTVTQTVPYITISTY